VALAVVMKQRHFNVDAVDSQVRPDRLAHVVDSGLEDLVRTHHALGADGAVVPRALSGPHRQQVGSTTTGGRLGAGVEEGTVELEAAAARPFEGPHQVGPVDQLAAVWNEKLVEVAKQHVATGHHLSVEAVLDGQRLSVVPDVVRHRFRKSPVDDVDPTSAPVATPGGVMLNHVVRL